MYIINVIADDETTIGLKKTKTKTKHNKTQLTKHKFDAMWIDFMNKTCSEAVL
jgi:hypothetical protein